MISVLFTILKIIGITLLVLLAILLLIILAVLFVPVKYCVQGAYKDSVVVEGRVSYAFPLLNIKVKYEESLQYTIRILGIPLRFGKKKPQKEPASGVNYGLVQPGDEKSNESPDTKKITIKKEQPVENSPIGENEITEEKEKIKFTDKIRTFFEKLKNIKSKVSEIKGKIEYYIEVLNSDVGKKAIATCKERLLKLLKSICPKKGEINITFGLDDPATMGKILGWHGMLYAYIGNLVYLYPDFENKCFACDFYVKGKIRFGTILYQVLRVITDKNCRQLLTLLKGRK